MGLDMESIRLSAKRGIVYHDPTDADEYNEGNVNNVLVGIVSKDTKKLTSRKYEWGGNDYSTVIERFSSGRYLQISISTPIVIVLQFLGHDQFLGSILN